MNNTVLVRGADRALYINGELVGTWDKHDLRTHVDAQIEARCGEDGFAERDHEGTWPESLGGENKKAPPKKASPKEEPDQGDLELVEV